MSTDTFVIAHDHPALPGHFPGRPIGPGWFLPYRLRPANLAAGAPAVGPLRLPQVKFLQPLLPGETARIALDPGVDRDGARRWKFRVLRGDTTIASGEVATG